QPDPRGHPAQRRERWHLVTGSVARLTPPGRAALATLGLSGEMWGLVRELFRTRSGGTLPEAPVAGRFWLGTFGAELADEVVLAVRRTEPELRVEIHAHGGRAGLAVLVELLAARGGRPQGWGGLLGARG